MCRAFNVRKAVLVHLDPPCIQHILDSLGPVLDLGDLAVSMIHLSVQLKQHVLASCKGLAALVAAVCRDWRGWLVRQQGGEVLAQLVFP